MLESGRFHRILLLGHNLEYSIVFLASVSHLVRRSVTHIRRLLSISTLDILRLLCSHCSRYQLLQRQLRLLRRCCYLVLCGSVQVQISSFSSLSHRDQVLEVGVYNPIFSVSLSSYRVVFDLAFPINLNGQSIRFCFPVLSTHIQWILRNGYFWESTSITKVLECARSPSRSLSIFWWS